MKPLPPFFSFYGSKHQASKHYEAPRYGTIIEPFAGSACYSLHHYDRRVVLVERDPDLAALWRYLIGSTEADIRKLPDIGPEQCVEDLGVCRGAELLIGMWLNSGATYPRKRLSEWGKTSARADPARYCSFWGPRARDRVASHIEAVNHWTVIEGDWSNAPSIFGTWFIDPPYQKAGRHYRYGSDLINFQELGRWCRSRHGQVIVCEQEGADWLPFQSFRTMKASEGRHGPCGPRRSGKSKEVVWASDQQYALRDGVLARV